MESLEPVSQQRQRSATTARRGWQRAGAGRQQTNAADKDIYRQDRWLALGEHWGTLLHFFWMLSLQYSFFLPKTFETWWFLPGGNGLGFFLPWAMCFNTWLIRFFSYFAWCTLNIKNDRRNIASKKKKERREKGKMCKKKRDSVTASTENEWHLENLFIPCCLRV